MASGAYPVSVDSYIFNSKNENDGMACGQQKPRGICLSAPVSVCRQPSMAHATSVAHQRLHLLQRIRVFHGGQVAGVTPLGHGLQCAAQQLATACLGQR